MVGVLVISVVVAAVSAGASASELCEPDVTCTHDEMDHQIDASDSKHLGHAPPSVEPEESVSTIIRGEPVELGKYPWMIYANGCSASLISPSYVLLAAHCFGSEVNDEGTLEGLTFSSDPVGFGHPDRTSDEMTRHEVVEVHMHPDYLPLTVEERYGLEPNDVALLELASPILLEAYLRLPTRDPIPGEGVIAAGWGQTESGQQPAMLQEAVLTVARDSDCFVGDDIRFCTIGNDSRSNVAPGDSGGPVFVDDGDGYMVLGTNSAANADSPNPLALHARTIAFVPWILSIAGDEFSCAGEGDDVVCEANIDECALGIDECGNNGVCENTVDAYTCECDDGFSFDGVSCVEETALEPDPAPAPKRAAGCGYVASGGALGRSPVWVLGLAIIGLVFRRRREVT